MQDGSKGFSMGDFYSTIWKSFLGKPHFQNEASHFALDMSTKSSYDISALLQCNRKIALQNKNRFASFFEDKELLPAALAYNGQAYRYLRADTFSKEDLSFAQKHLWIISYLYGLLRPADLIHPYRMEGNVRLPWAEGLSLFDFWKSRLTDFLISSVKADDGILVHLTTKEMEHLFDWKRVKECVRIVQPQFYIRRDHKYKIIPTYEKTFRGAMVRYMIEHRVTTPEGLYDFDPGMLPEGKMIFI